MSVLKVKKEFIDALHDEDFEVGGFKKVRKNKPKEDLSSKSNKDKNREWNRYSKKDRWK